MNNTQEYIDILHEILKQAKELSMCEPYNETIGYTMPDGKHHIFIYIDQLNDGSYFVIEPNRVIDRACGCCKPMDNTFMTKCDDFGMLMIGCMWCFKWFEEDEEITQ